MTIVPVLVPVKELVENELLLSSNTPLAVKPVSERAVKFTPKVNDPELIAKPKPFVTSEGNCWLSVKLPVPA